MLGNSFNRKRFTSLLIVFSFLTLESSVRLKHQNIVPENGLKKKISWSYKGSDFKSVLSFLKKNRAVISNTMFLYCQLERHII